MFLFSSDMNWKFGSISYLVTRCQDQGRWYFCADSGYFCESVWGGSEEVVSNVEQVVLGTTWSREEGQQH